MVVGLLLTVFAAIAGATPIGPGDGTGFEIEGNQLDGTPADPPIDWADVIGTPTLSVFSDVPEASGLVQGSQEQNPDGFVCDDHSSPPKDNILQVAVNQRITPAASYLDLAIQRLSGNGNTHVNFEFNQNPMSLDCAGSTPGFDTRTDGDLLLLLDFPGNGTAEVQVYRWDAPPAPGDAHGDGQWILTPDLPIGLATGAENAVDLTPAQNPLFGGITIPERAFAEVSVNLGIVLGETPGSTECTRFGSVSVRSRAAGSSITSELKDIVGPNPINLSTCGGVTIHKTDDAGNPLPGATFGLYESEADAEDNLNAVATCVSDATGLCDFGEVAPDTYYVAEISAPAGYNPDPDIVEVEVGPREQVDIAAPFVDPRQVGFVRIDKVLVSETGAPLTPDSLADLNGATFVLRQGGVVASLWPTPPSNDPATCTITNSQGFCVIGPVPVGTYEVLETVAPTGTSPGTQPGPVTVTEGTAPQAVEVDYPNVSETPTITITKTATPTEVFEPGSDVAFDLVITNTSSFETLTLDTLNDDVFGNLLDGANGAITGNTCDDLAGDSLAPGAQVSCSFTAFVAGSAGDPAHVNTATVVAHDDENEQATDNDDATVDFDDVAELVVEKTADPGSVPEPGDDVTFTVDISNTSALHSITIDSILDDVFGDLGDAGNAAVSANTCVALIGTTLPAQGATSCSFVGAVEGLAVAGDPAEHQNTVTVTGTDDAGTVLDDDDDAIVDITDVPPVVQVTKTASDDSIPENTLTPIDFTVVVTNGSVEPVTIDSLVDDVFGTLTGDDDCKVGIELGVGESCEFTFTANLIGDAAGDPHENTVTVVVNDGEGNTDDDSDPATVAFEDVPPTVLVDKTANPVSVPENTPTDVTYTVTVTNTSNEAVTIASLVDDVFGTLAGDADCQVGTPLAVGGSCTFTFTGELTGDASGGPHTNTVTVVVTDNDGTPGQDDDPAEVLFTDVPPTVNVTKDSDTESINDGSSAQVTFTVVVTNTSDEAVTITSLTDSVFGTLVGDADCQVGTVLAVDASCTFTFTETIAGTFGNDHSNVVTVEVTDDDDTTGTDTDDETIPVNSTTTTVAPTTTVDPTTSTSAPTEVLGVQQTAAALPQTGAESFRVLLIGLGILAVGAGLVLLSVYAQERRRYDV